MICVPGCPYKSIIVPDAASGTMRLHTEFVIRLRGRLKCITVNLVSSHSACPSAFGAVSIGTTIPEPVMPYHHSSTTFWIKRSSNASTTDDGVVLNEPELLRTVIGIVFPCTIAVNLATPVLHANLMRTIIGFHLNQIVIIYPVTPSRIHYDRLPPR